METTRARALDFTSGQTFSTLGHNDPRIAAAVRQVLEEVVHLSSWMLPKPVLALAEQLVSLLPAPLDKVISAEHRLGGERVALKLAKMHTGRFEVVGRGRKRRGDPRNPNSTRPRRPATKGHPPAVKPTNDRAVGNIARICLTPASYEGTMDVLKRAEGRKVNAEASGD